MEEVHSVLVEGAGLQLAGLLVRGAGVGVEPADARGGEVAGGAGPGADRVEGRDRVAGSHLAAVHPVVAEVLVGDLTVVVSDQPELLDGLRVEGDLCLGVAGREVDVLRKLLAEDLAGVLDGRDVRRVAVALVGEGGAP